MKAKPKFCECGNEVQVFYANHWICHRCRDLAQAAMYQRYVSAADNQERGGQKKMKITSMTYTRAWRTNMVGRFCECGRQAVTNRNGYFICEKCLRLDALASQAAHRRDTVGHADGSLDHLRGRLVEGRRTDSAMLDPDMVRVTVTETAEEIVVQAHGEYHLKLSTGLELVLEQEGVCGV